jgi:hypothetical protein
MRRRCFGPCRSLLVSETISEVRGILGIGVEILTEPMMLVLLPNGHDGLSSDVGVLHYHSIYGSKHALDAVFSGLFGASSLPSPEAALSRVETTKFEKYSEGVRSHPDIRFIPFAVTELGAVDGHATAVGHNWSSKQPHLKGCILASCWSLGTERFLSPSMSITRTTSCAGCPRRGRCAVWRPLVPRLGYLVLPRRSLLAPRAVSVLPCVGREALPLVASTCRVCSVAWEYHVLFRVFFVRFVLILVLPLCRALDSVTLLSLLPSWYSPFFPSIRHVKILISIEFIQTYRKFFFDGLLAPNLGCMLAFWTNISQNFEYIHFYI